MTKKLMPEDLFEQVASGQLINDKQRIFLYVKKRPGITLSDLSRGTKLMPQTASGRLSELMDLGVIEVRSKTKTIGMVKLTTDSMLYVQEEPAAILENRKNRAHIKFTRSVAAVLKFREHLSPELIEELKRLLKPKTGAPHAENG